MPIADQVAIVQAKVLAGYRGLMRTGPVLVADYASIDFGLGAAEVATNVYWITNDCNRRTAAPAVASFSKEMRTSIATGTRPPAITDYLKAIYRSDTDRSGPAAAFTIALIGTTQPGQAAVSTAFCTSATNRRVGKGQVHAEYVTTRLAVDLATEWAASANHTIEGLKLYTLTCEIAPKKNSSELNQSAFPPCISCTNNIKAIIQHLQGTVASVTQLGDAIV